MKYSPIKNWRVKNFRNIGDVTIDFTKSPIVTLIGENESGKTSIVKSFEVVGYNGNSKGQKDYIRDDTNGFGISGNFLDGSSVVRMKSNATNMFQVEVPGKPVFQTNKMDGTEVPPEVQEVMGMVMEHETKEPLHVRTYENQLLFVLTKSSENYKVMYNALKVDNLTKAIKDGSQEVNAFRALIKSNEISIDSLTSNLRSIHIVDIEPAVNIKNRLKAEINQLEKLESAMRLVKRNNELNKQLGSLMEAQKLESISLSEISKFIQFNSVRNRLVELNKYRDVYSELETVEHIDLSKEQKLSTLLGYVSRNSGLEKTKARYDDIKSLEHIKIEVLAAVERCIDLVNKTKKIENTNKKYIEHGVESIDEREVYRANSMSKIISLLAVNTQKSQEERDCREQANKLNTQIRELGALVGTCKNCGESVIMEV